MKNTTLLIGLLTVSISFAQDKLKIQKGKPLTLDYEFSQWNRDPNDVDSAFVALKDANSGKIVKVLLQESDNNSGKFQGHYVISFNTIEEIIPEIYVPPQSITKSDKADILARAINEGTIPRKPFFLRVEGQSQKLTIYNSKEQAFAAFENFKKNPGGAPIIDHAALAAKRAAELAKEQKRLADQAAVQELQRIEMELIEKRKQEELKRKMEEQSLAEKSRRKAQAASLAQEALKLYQAERYKDAEKLFKQITEIDPSQTAYHFQYGVTLYKNEKYNESLVAFKLATDPSVNTLELEFYKGLAYMKLKEYNEALEAFQKVQAANNPTMSPSAAFYVGLVHFSNERYKDARKAFEYTLDNSTDPKMDEQAENYIEQIANLEEFQEKRKKKFTFDMSVGLNYDSNVLLVSDSNATAASPTDLVGYRTMLLANLEYRAFYTEAHEWTPVVSYIDMYTVDSGFKPDADLQKADPSMLTAKLPYKYKGKLFNKAYQVTFTPGYETLNLNADGTGSREQIMRSTFFGLDQTFIVRDDYMTTVTLESRSDDSLLSGDSGTNSDATKTSVANKNIWFTDSKKSVAWLGNVGYTMNAAKGDDERYNKMELSVGYLTPYRWESSLVTQLAYASTTYANHSSSRKDANTALNVAMSKPLSKDLNLAVALNYTLNGSNVDSYKYSKYAITTLLNWAVNF